MAKKSLTTRLVCMALAVLGFIIMVILIAAGQLEVSMVFGLTAAALFLYAGW